MAECCVEKKNIPYYGNHMKQHVNLLCGEAQLFIVAAANVVLQMINSQAENFT
jgi:hypothetical protein